MQRAIHIVTFCYLAFSTPAQAGLVVNEALSNEPGTSITLEWFELFNDASTAANMNFHQIQIGATLVDLNDPVNPVIIQPRDYLVICRQLYDAGSSPGFESVWGDSSGVWGDNAVLESYTVIEYPFGLPNTGGSIVLSGFSSSTLTWTTSGSDGVSWERVLPTADSVDQSIDPAGSTPGRVNSHTPVAFDLTIDTVVFNVTNDSTTASINIVNIGDSAVANAAVGIYRGDLQAPFLDSLVLQVVLPFVDVGFSSLVVRRAQLSAMYDPVTIFLSDDDRSSNNRSFHVAPGPGFPPVLINEFLANPPMPPEWVELKNLQDTAIDLHGWYLGDALGEALISDTTVPVAADDYVLLTPDAINFLLFNPGVTAPVVDMPSWQILNDAGDVVRLIDPFGNLAGSFTYSNTFSDGETWSRGEIGASVGTWGRSTNPGGTPGTINSVRFVQTGNSLEVSVIPDVIAPDGVGLDEEAIITVSGPPAAGYSIRLYDRNGRLVRTFEDDASDLASEYRWDGRSDSGGKLPIGIYILHVEAAGVESLKRTIVVAR